MADIAMPPSDELRALADLLRRRGHVRGNPVAISLFASELPAGYEGKAVEPCAILRQAMDFGERVYVDADHQACLAGAWQAGFVEAPLPIRTGRYLADHTPYFTPEGAERVKTGVNAIPVGTLRAIGAAPLDDVPPGVDVDWIAVACRPQDAATIAGVRAALDGTPPSAGGGTSLCGDMFAVPWHDRNVVMTPGDMGGRMFNHAKPDEMFVIVPVEYAAHLTVLLSQRPDLGALLEAIKPGYTAERDAKRAARSDATVALQWDGDAEELLAAAPEEIREFARPTVEAYAAEHGHDRITRDVIAAQMESIGMSLDDVIALTEEARPVSPAHDDRPAGEPEPKTHELDTRAPVHASAAVAIDAAPAQVWAVLLDAARWNEWYDEIRNVAADGPLAAGSAFSFSAGPVRIEAVVDEMHEAARLRFHGKARGSTADYLFTLAANDAGGTDVWVEQTMKGMTAKAMRPMLQKVIGTSLPQWLDALRRRSEGRS